LEGKIDYEKRGGRWEDNRKLDIKEQRMWIVDDGNTETLVAVYKKSWRNVIENLNLYLKLNLTE
jgi:hypothetical protein